MIIAPAIAHGALLMAEIRVPDW